MKHLKLMMAALAIMMGLTMTSCLGDEEEVAPTITTVAKLRSAFPCEFITDDGFVIVPSSSSVSKFEANNSISLSKYLNNVCYIIYTLPAGKEIKEGDKGVEDVTLEGLATLNSKVERVSEKGAVNDSINKAAIISLGKEGNEYLKPAMFDATTVFLCIDYFLLNKGHDFTLVDYLSEQPEDEEGALTFYLRHNNNDDSMMNTSTTSYTWAKNGYVWFLYHGFDITASMMDYQMQNGGKKPEVIKIVTYENATTPSLESAKPMMHYIEYKY
ncbi:MAG: hypothetical protein IKK07_01860 [Bacteroides sp.]|nr:hypothetical protein [Bacteroides sp.]